MRKKRINVAFVTGCRSEYDIVYPVARAMKVDPDFTVSLIVCGAHLSERFGRTIGEVQKDGFQIARRIYNLLDSDREVGKAKGTGLLMAELSDALDEMQPDFVAVVGDREEAIVCGVVCTYLGIPLIHLCGGDRTAPKAGDVDEAIRHATSKMAALHFTMNEEHKKRLLKMGEEPWRVFNTGNPALDRFADVPRMTKGSVLRFFGFNAKANISKPLCLVVQHVISGEVQDAERQMKNTLEAVTHLKCNCVINYPNTDMGSRKMVEIIESYRELSNVRISQNIPRKEFVNLLRNLDLLVGNSSMALLEGSFLKIPAINVGNRNADRMNGGNVVFVNASMDQIHKAAKAILFNPKVAMPLKNCKSIYGNGKASARIIWALKNIKKTRIELTAKGITY